ncbi:MAG: hypothetical protein U0R52_00205 [Solirubrobacterales bacterium]
MQSNAVKAGVGLLLVAVAVVLFIVLQGGGGGGSETTSTRAAAGTGTGGGAGGDEEAVPTIVVKNGKPVGGIADLDYTSGDTVRFRVRSDVSDEVHVHGYDRMKDVEAGGTIGFDFTANIEGIFEVELEGRKEQIAELRVNP